METYPQVMTEWETLELVLQNKLSMSRFGDGEIRLAMGQPAKPCKTQRHEPGLDAELRTLLEGHTQSLICLPRIRPGIPLYDKLWVKFLQPKWTKLIGPAPYGSSFISRPESAPEIDVPEYWERVTRLWAGQHVTLVIGQPEDGKHYSLTPEHMLEAKSLDLITGPQRDAYRMIDMLDAQIGSARDRVVIMCLGATATCLVERCAKRGVQALDLGSIGKWIARWREGRIAACLSSS